MKSRIIAAIVLASQSSCTFAYNSTYRLSYATLDHVDISWHDEAISSGLVDFYGEGCVVDIDPAVVRSMVDLIVAGRNTKIESSKKEFDPHIVITRSDGARLLIYEANYVADFDGSTYAIGGLRFHELQLLAFRQIEGLSCAPDFPPPQMNE